MRIENLSQGEYILHISLEAEDDGIISVFTSHRRFLVRNAAVKRGERLTLDFAAAVKRAAFQKQADYNDDFIDIIVCGKCLAEAYAEKAEMRVIYTLGDSTVCDQPSFGKGEKYRCCGWGQTLPMFLGTKFAVSNHAEQGAHTGDCLKTQLPPVLSQMKKGDIAIMQFGHNDQKQPWLTETVYAENLRKISSAIKQRGGVPIICTPINRLIYENGALNSYLADYAEAARAAARAEGILCVDLHSFTSRLYEEMGEGAEELFFRSDTLDRTHTNDNGGCVIGEYVSKFV